MFKVNKVQAHCDIPCKVYDPSIAQYAALSVVRLIDIIEEVDEKNPQKTVISQISRLTSSKEEQAQMVKDEIAVIWGDYFKEPQIKEHPQVHELVHSIMMAGSKCKQELSRKNGEDLLNKVNEFAKIFWETKNVATQVKKAPYLPGLDIVCPVLEDA